MNGDGDITNPENLKEFEKFVLSSTNGKGVHFVMADGVSEIRDCPENMDFAELFLKLLLFKGFSVEGNENIQEILSKQLYLCQFLCAISVLRIGKWTNCFTIDKV